MLSIIETKTRLHMNDIAQFYANFLGAFRALLPVRIMGSGSGDSSSVI